MSTHFSKCFKSQRHQTKVVSGDKKETKTMKHDSVASQKCESIFIFYFKVLKKSFPFWVFLENTFRSNLIASDPKMFDRKQKSFVIYNMRRHPEYLKEKRKKLLLMLLSPSSRATHRFGMIAYQVDFAVVFWSSWACEDELSWKKQEWEDVACALGRNISFEVSGSSFNHQLFAF